MANQVKKINNSTIELMKKKSILALPNNPSEQGVSPTTIKQYLTAPMLGDSNSLVSEINRIVGEINEIFGLDLDENILELTVENGNLVLISTESLPAIQAETFSTLLDEINTLLGEISEKDLEDDPTFIPSTYKISYNSSTDVLSLINNSTNESSNVTLGINEKISALESALSLKASSSALSNTNSRVSTLESTSSNLESRVTSLESNSGSGSGSGTSITVDSALSESSTNPVQNSVITQKINSLNASIEEFEDVASRVDQLEQGLIIETTYEGLEDNWSNKEKIGTLYVGGNNQYPIYVNKDADTASQVYLYTSAQGNTFPPYGTISGLFTNNNYRRYNGYLVTLGITTTDGKYTGRKITILLSALTELTYYYNNFNPDYEISFNLTCNTEGTFVLDGVSDKISKIDIVNIIGI